MVAGTKPRTYPPYYPHDGTYADLLCWHMDYWGTRPKGSTAVNGEPWTKNEFKHVFWGEESNEPNPRVLLGNWRGNGSAPGSEHGATVHRILFGDNPNFRAWANDLESARKRSQGKKNNPQTAEIPDPLSISPQTGRVPRPTAHFIGRDEDVETLAAALTTDHGQSAVLIQGGPGIGKTELTKAIAHHPDVAARFGEHRYFVPLETATTAAAMCNAIARALGCDPQDSFQAAPKTLREKPSLLILDNLETPWEAERQSTHEALAELLGLPDVAILASIRGRPFVDGLRWHPYPLDELTENAAIDLFVSVAGEPVRGDPLLPDFMDALGGSPLAIQLVARRADEKVGLKTLWKEWKRIGTAFAKTNNASIGRLTSLDHSIELSFALCANDRPTVFLFSILGFFPSGLSRVDVDILVGINAFDAEERLRKLGISIINGERIDLLPSVREYARTHYPLEDSSKLICAEHFTEIFKNLAIMVDSPRASEALKIFSDESNNLLKLLDMLVNSMQDGLLKKLVRTLMPLVRVRQNLALSFMNVANYYCDNGDLSGEADALALQARIVWNTTDYREQYDLSAYHRAMSLYRDVGDIRGQLLCLNEAFDDRDPEDLHRFLDSALKFAMESGDKFLEAKSLLHLSGLEQRRNYFVTASIFSERSETIFREIGNFRYLAHSLMVCGHCLYNIRRYDAGFRKMSEAVKLARAIGPSSEAGSALAYMYQMERIAEWRANLDHEE